MLTLHLVAKTYHRRPSEIVGIADEWAAYQFDTAVLLTALEDSDGAAGGTADGGPVSFDAGGWSDLA